VRTSNLVKWALLKTPSRKLVTARYGHEDGSTCQPYLELVFRCNFISFTTVVSVLRHSCLRHSARHFTRSSTDNDAWKQPGSSEENKRPLLWTQGTLRVHTPLRIAGHYKKTYGHLVNMENSVSSKFLKVVILHRRAWVISVWKCDELMKHAENKITSTRGTGLLHLLWQCRQTHRASNEIVILSRLHFVILNNISLSCSRI
jgi:hypothetical protein